MKKKQQQKKKQKQKAEDAMHYVRSAFMNNCVLRLFSFIARRNEKINK